VIELAAHVIAVPDCGVHVSGVTGTGSHFSTARIVTVDVAVTAAPVDCTRLAVGVTLLWAVISIAARIVICASTLTAAVALDVASASRTRVALTAPVAEAEEAMAASRTRVERNVSVAVAEDAIVAVRTRVAEGDTVAAAATATTASLTMRPEAVAVAAALTVI
jgi:hypothetical protein